MCTKGDFNPRHVKPEFTIWKTIEVGTGIKDADGFRQALNANGFKVDDRANDILGKPAFRVAIRKARVELVLVTVRRLGFRYEASLRDIYANAEGRGLGICPNEVGPQLRLQYLDQPLGEWLAIGMEPIIDSNGRLALFGVGHDGVGRWLDCYCCHADDVWHADYCFVFTCSGGAS